MSQEKVSVVAVQRIDFTPADSKEPIKGSKVYFCRPAYQNELGRGWTKNIVLGHAFIRADSNVIVPEFPSLPCNCVFNYEPQGRYNALVSIEVAK